MTGLSIHLSGRLWQQFVVDAFAAVDQYRLDWIRGHQHIIRSYLYKWIQDSVQNGDTNPGVLGKDVILPATHTGSQRYMNQYFKHSLAICRTIGHHSLILNMTCNTQWPEIKWMLDYLPRVDVVDAPDIVARVFKLKTRSIDWSYKKEELFWKVYRRYDFTSFSSYDLSHSIPDTWVYLKLTHLLTIFKSHACHRVSEAWSTSLSYADLAGSEE